MLTNQANQYGVVQIALHWLIALTIFGLFGLGLWMVELTYYSSWYLTAPDIHRSIGVIVVSLMILRLLWRLANPKVVPLATHKTWERKLAHVTHALMYVLILLLGISGYMITTAKGQALQVFDWFSIPAISFGIEYQEDIAGDLHEIFAWSLIGLAVLHIAGALKHHFVVRDNTLKRMLP
ncbi:MAG: cytochrome b [Thiomicrospira sp.]|uniref:cytochrome b n=1 Tax=Thiomicrospira sp. TaxID=935 RepID=UPI0019D9C70B|nr:cytochrome b [Thiomicrospira sp.]MBE0493481.1 cytochrome b [Thiomicrospira sp.]